LRFPRVCLIHLTRARGLSRPLGRSGLCRVHEGRRGGQWSGASVSWRVLHETKNRLRQPSTSPMQWCHPHLHPTRPRPTTRAAAAVRKHPPRIAQRSGRTGPAGTHEYTITCHAPCATSARRRSRLLSTPRRERRRAEGAHAPTRGAAPVGSGVHPRGRTRGSIIMRGVGGGKQGRLPHSAAASDMHAAEGVWGRRWASSSQPCGGWLQWARKKGQLPPLQLPSWEG
jgi:hypothetical protein